MLRNLKLCVLIALAVVGYSQECKYQWFQCESDNTPFVCKSPTHPGWIPRSQLCEGTKHCPDGSDESMQTCKLHPNEAEAFSDNSFCVNGGIILSKSSCDGTLDCWDGSDEMGCDGGIDLEAYRGNCSESMVKCKSENKCIKIKKLCNNEYDCNDGWDESLSMCFNNCESGKFQCGNGVCIEGSLVCDNKLDCLDGADELPNVCVDIPNYIPMPSINCTLSKNKRVFNREDTIPHIKGGEKYFLPHEKVHLRCPTFRRPIGSEWNVCNTTGQWQFKMLECNPKNKKN